MFEIQRNKTIVIFSHITTQNPQSFQRGELKRARLMIPVASMYLSTQREMQLLSPPLRLVPGFVTHFAKHFFPTVCHNVQKKINGNTIERILI
jgi:hypothetical protein